MSFFDRPTLVAATAFAFALAASAYAQGAKPNAAPSEETDNEEQSTPTPLTVGSLAIASDANLVVDSMSLDVATDKVVYAYAFRNKGKTKLSLAASVALPDLEVNTEGNVEYDLPAANPENPVGLAINVDGKLVPTQPYIQAIALGIDRLADLKAAQIPLIPFGDDVDKALGAAKPETIAKLEGLGLVTPRDPAQASAPPLADWSLRVVHGLTLAIEPSAAVKASVGFAPIKATYAINAQSLTGLDALKDQVCVTPQASAAAKALLKGKTATAQVDDIVLSNDGPARWLDNPAATISVHKPKPSSVVVFCGMNAATAGQPVVTGKVPSSNEASGLRILIFTAQTP